ncbi:cell division protein [Marinobacter zhanjiangensis]|uniref:Cell division protein n=1 Tax=Marinobacter zhanjiangensis TaxID=578215 RepID=A0ABQ3B7S0_9GAMM|nr:cell division protein [Marinobacter zhanjiangensis]
MLISLAVIFVPMMFDEPHDERDVRSLDIPEEPPFPEVSVPEQDDSMSGVPDYRVEELEPAPTPEVVEDPAMGSQPAVGSDGEGDSSPGEARQDSGGQTAESGENPAGEESPAPAAQTQDAESGQAASSEPDPDLAPADPDTRGEGDFERTLEGAWVLQLGSFGNEDNARRLRDSVRDRGYGAHLQEVVRGDQRLVRVFSGPFAEKAEAEKAKQVLDEAFGVKSLVTRGEE